MADHIRFTFKLDMLPTMTLNVLKFTLKEALSAPFCLELDLISRNENINEDDILDQNATFILWRNDEVDRYVTGIISSFSREDCQFTQRHYKLTLAPALMRLSLRQNSRIFQNQSVDKIITLLLKEMGVNEYAFALTRDLPKREYCVQYRETDLAFISRLAAEEGMAYAFEHKRDKSTLFFFDGNRSLKHLSKALIYNNMPMGNTPTPFVSSFSNTTKIKPTSAYLQDYSFKNPANKLSFLAHTALRDPYEHYDFPGRFKDSQQGKVYTKQRLEYLRSDAVTGKGESNNMQLTTGIKAMLTEHPDTSFNILWMITQVEHFGEQPQSAEEFAGQSNVQYKNIFHTIPSSEIWRPDPIQKPMMFGPQIAVVTGPDKEEIFCDDKGRVKIYFPWDRYHLMSEKSSCWVRVSQEWAGAHYGMMVLPRVGNEVIVSFLEGDPDQPIITGKAFNALNMSPYSLPEKKTKTVIRTNTYKGKGYNELSFDDENNAQEIYFHAEKDIKYEIKNDHLSLISKDQCCVINHDKKTQVDNNNYTHIKVDEHLTIGGDQYIKINKNVNTTINGEQITQIQKDKTQQIYGTTKIQSKKAYILDSNGDVSIKSGAKIILDAANEISLKVGSNFICIDASGIHLKGAQVNINSGGSASSAAPFDANAPITPLLPTPTAWSKASPITKNSTHVENNAPIPTPQLQSTQITAGENIKAANVKTTKENTENRAGELFDKTELLYSDAIQKTADKYRIVIGLRAPNKLGQLHLKEGHPSKNFHIKAKSSNAGPTVGFIPEKALYSKIKQTPKNTTKHKDNIQDSLNKGGKLVPLILTSRQIEQAIAAGLMTRLNATTYSADHHGVTISFTIDENGKVADFDGDVMVLTNPPEKSKTPRKSKLVQNLDMPVTADYDLFAILPRNNANNNAIGFECAPRFMKDDLDGKSESYQLAAKTLTSPKKVVGAYHLDQGNTHYFGETINADLNKNVKAEGYTGGVLFWHGNEVNNPYSPGLDIDADKPIFFIPEEPPRQIFTKKQLNLFYKEMRDKGYSVVDNPRF